MSSPNPNDCSQLAGIIGSSVITVLLIISEVLPFIRSLKGNGILHTLKTQLDKAQTTPVGPTSVEADVENSRILPD